MKNITAYLFTLIIILMTGFAPAQSAAAQDTPKTFMFIRPDPGIEPHPFFDEFELAMRAACTALGNTLIIRYAGEDPFLMVEHIEEAATLDPKPNAIVFMTMRLNGIKALEALEKIGIDGFLINAGLTQEQYQQAGEPRGKFKHWLGQMLPNDVSAGHLLAQSLYEQAIEKNPKIKESGVKMLAIEANAGDAASILRTQGLNEFTSNTSNLEVLQIVKGHWEEDKAYELTAHMLKRYKTINTIWAASDAMAIGAAKAATQNGLMIGHDIFIGGVDWSQQGFDAIGNNSINASAGGHILEGAWAAIILHDYYSGHDFKDQEGLKMNSPMYIADAQNLPDIRSKFGARNWDKIDFTAFSKAVNPSITRYNFSILDAGKKAQE